MILTVSKTTPKGGQIAKNGRKKRGKKRAIYAVVAACCPVVLSFRQAKVRAE
jgi:hypothetical protein